MEHCAAWRRCSSAPCSSAPQLRVFLKKAKQPTPAPSVDAHSHHHLHVHRASFPGHGPHDKQTRLRFFYLFIEVANSFLSKSRFATKKKNATQWEERGDVLMVAPWFGWACCCNSLRLLNMAQRTEGDWAYALRLHFHLLTHMPSCTGVPLALTHTFIHTHKHTHTHRQAGRQADRQADRQTGRQTGRQTDRQTHTKLSHTN